ncbi:hypothetical protein HTSR_0935 [Halodesulfurarchaeum formicicum]|uniref:Uncharacterized protein n=1 Tax=Halodesulfurarchaeum formicicum TaxID=1873524 RepID=A0A1D8S437_9EURY|nr:hypothetical protein HTSR_0935 [Halodesulfurarchaeum formicicum]
MRESQNFLRRAEKLDLTQSEDREQWYDLVEQYTNRIEKLRNRDEITEAPIEVFGAVDELIEELSETNPPVPTTTATIARNPLKKAQNKKEDKKKEQEHIEQARTEQDYIAEMIEGVMSAFDDG